jgi:general secretion pathway protein E
MQLSQQIQKIDLALIQRARVEATQQGRNLLELLEENSMLGQDAFVEALANTLQYVPIDIKEMQTLEVDFTLVPFSLAQQKTVIAFKDKQQHYTLAFADPFDEVLQNWVLANVPHQVNWRLAHQKEIFAYLTRHEDSMRAMDAIDVDNVQTKSHQEEVVIHLSLKTINEDSNATVRLVNSTLYDALKTGASDIHLECHAAGLTIKYRIDGVLATISNIQGQENADQAISRIKVLAQLDISERRIPQDGRFKVQTQQGEVDLRVSIMPSSFGEDAVLRVLDRKSLTDEIQGLSLTSLGFSTSIIQKFRRLTLEPYGMVLVTGPTGSGKTTSLYAAISEVNTGHDKIITIEDPVEYQLPGVLQIPVNEKKGLTFARGLRSILRHDPDKIMVGEIRDAETAQIAIQAALTGHLVFTTVHANNVLDVISRFMHMGVDPYSFVSSVNGILAQRLIRILCPHCAESYTPSAELLEESKISAAEAAHMSFKTANGCGHCRGTGYKGRKSIAELLILNDEIRELIIARAPIRKLKEAAKQTGMQTIREAALEAVREGKTTLQEINRVTFVG